MKYKNWKNKHASYYYENKLDDVATIENKFERIYKDNLWEIHETKSGVASQKEWASNALGYLSEIISKYSIKSILDAPCGDVNWIKPIWDIVGYHGVDIVYDLIENNTEKYSAINDVEFSCINILSSKLPASDLIFCRDLFIHLSNDSVLQALDNIRKSNPRFLLTTSYNKIKNNDDIEDGNYRPINLEIEPFNLIKPKLFFTEPYWFEDDFGRGMGLWEII